MDAPAPRSNGPTARAVFLDRDGTLIEDIPYLNEPQRVRLLPRVAASLRTLKAHGFKLVLTSNQSGIGRGLISRDAAEAVHERFVELLANEGVELDGVFYCPHQPGAACSCRKPQPGMILEAAAVLDIRLADSFMVGNAASDVEAGLRAGCRTIFVGDADGGAAAPDLRVATLADAVPFLLAA